MLLIHELEVRYLHGDKAPSQNADEDGAAGNDGHTNNTGNDRKDEEDDRGLLHDLVDGDVDKLACRSHPVADLEEDGVGAKVAEVPDDRELTGVLQTGRILAGLVARDVVVVVLDAPAVLPRPTPVAL